MQRFKDLLCNSIMLEFGVLKLIDYILHEGKSSKFIQISWIKDDEIIPHKTKLRII